MNDDKQSQTSNANSSAISRRKMIRQTITLSAAAALTGCVTKETDRTVASKGTNPIRQENARLGTRDWLLTNTRIDPKTKYRCPWIEGYCSRTSVRAGESISFHVSTNPASPFTLDIYRMGYYGGAGRSGRKARGPIQRRKLSRTRPSDELRLRECRWSPCTTLKFRATG